MSIFLLSVYFFSEPSMPFLNCCARRVDPATARLQELEKVFNQMEGGFVQAAHMVQEYEALQQTPPASRGIFGRLKNATPAQQRKDQIEQHFRRLGGAAEARSMLGEYWVLRGSVLTTTTASAATTTSTTAPAATTPAGTKAPAHTLPPETLPYWDTPEAIAQYNAKLVAEDALRYDIQEHGRTLEPHKIPTIAPAYTIKPTGTSAPAGTTKP